jgi:hypothetical protein
LFNFHLLGWFVLAFLFSGWDWVAETALFTPFSGIGEGEKGSWFEWFGSDFPASPKEAFTTRLRLQDFFRFLSFFSFPIGRKP